MDAVLILLLALVLDMLLGEPPNSLHPVAGLGRLISLETGWTLKRGRQFQLLAGAAAVLLTLGAITVLTYLLVVYLGGLNRILYIVLSALLLKFTFSLRGLRQAVAAVRESLAENNLARARTSLKSLVSRETGNLNESQIISATVESAAENSGDSFVAPLFYFLLFGLPGAVAYRVINTFDSMVGYHDQWEHPGKFAARLDDLINFIPARITALIIVLAAGICRKNRSAAWRTMLRDRKKTESPNAGWTMSAMAGALGVRLEKAGHHQLGDNHSALTLDTISASRNIIMTTALIWGLIAILVEVIYLAAT